MKIRPVGAESFQADGQTDMTKLKAAFRNFLNAPKYTADYFSPTVRTKITSGQRSDRSPSAH